MDVRTIQKRRSLIIESPLKFDEVNIVQLLDVSVERCDALVVVSPEHPEHEHMLTGDMLLINYGQRGCCGL